MGRTSQLAFQISLPPALATKIADSVAGDNLTPVAKLASVAEGLMEQLGEGGIMLSVEDVDRLRETGHDIEGAEDIVKLAEEAANFDTGQCVVRATIDPANMPPLEEMAASNGTTVQQVAQDMFNFGIESGWLYEVPPGYHAVRLTPEQNKLVSEILGQEEFTGETLCQFLREKVLGIVEEEMPFSLEPDADQQPLAPDKIPMPVGAEK